MKYLTSSQISKIWNVSERSVRNYCASGRVVGAYLNGKTWMIPETANKPIRQVRHSSKERNLLDTLLLEKESQLKGGIYHKLQIEMTYNSNHIEGSKLTHDETRFIYETKTIGIDNKSIKIDDIIETVNHFRCIDLAIDMANKKLSESFIKQLHAILKTGTSDANQPWFKVGDYKLLANEVGNNATTDPKDVKAEMKKLLDKYNQKDHHTFEEIVDFHVNFERIHPFQDGNGRVGRLIAFKECLKNNIVPFIIFDEKKGFYYRGLQNYNHERGWLIDTCLDGQDIVKQYLDYFKIRYGKPVITLLKPIGHCFGVLKAIEIAKETRKKYVDKNIYVFGLLVHNEEVVKELESNDIKTIEMNEDNAIEILNKFTPNDVVIFTAHGHPEIYEDILKNNHVTYVDATCKKVKECFNAIKDAKEVIYIGKNHHPETVAALTMNKNAHLYDINQGFDYSLLKSNHPLVINQTTLSFLELESIHQEIKNKVPHAIFHDEICDATLLRQVAIKNLDSGVDTIIIVGSNKSSNTMKLYDISLKVHPDKQVIMVRDVNELKSKNIKFSNAVIASGTSTAYQTIAKIKEYLEGLNNE